MSGQLNSPWLSTSDLLAPVNALYQHQLEDAQSQSLLGDLDIKRQTLGLAYQKLAMNRAGNAALLGAANQPPPSGDGSSTTTDGSTPAAGGGGGGSFLDTLASVESGDKNIVSNTDKDSNGLTLAQGGNPAEISQGHFQIQTATWRDFAKQAGVDVNQYPNAMSAPRAVQAQVASVIPFNRFGPRTQTLMRSRFGPLDTSQTVGALAGTPALALNPNTAGPRVGGTATASSDQLPVPPIPPPAGDPNPANMAAVKQAATGLLAMPEADAATAYPGVVQELQSRGFAMNAPPTYPGHARLQAMVNDGTAAAPVPVTPSPIAARTGGTDVAGPGAGPDTTLPPLYSQNQAYQTGIPGITIGGAASPLAPPGTTPASLAAPATAAPTAAVAAPPAGTTAPPGGTGKPPVPIPPPAASRMIQTEPIYQSGPLMGLTQSQGKEAAGMALTDISPADLAKQMEVWRQQNITNRQTAATANVAQQTLDVQRQQQYYENQVKAGWETLPNGATYNRFTGEIKYPPTPRFGPQVVGPDGKPAIPVEGGAGGTQYLPVPGQPADAGYQAQKEAYQAELPQITEAAQQAQNARTSQIRWQTMLDLADKITTGSGGVTRAQLANIAETAGFPSIAQTLIAHTADGDTAAAQEFSKLTLASAGAAERGDLGSRGSLGAIKLYQQANPNLDLRPGANKNIIGMQLIAAQADADYNNAKVAFGNQQQDNWFTNGKYQPLSRFEQQWQTQRNPQVYAAAMGALAGQPASVWAKGLSDDPSDPNSEYKRALDVVSRASPSAVVNGKSGRISMQPNQPTAAPSGGGSPPVVARTPAEAQALPPGTTYTTPDGRTFTR